MTSLGSFGAAMREAEPEAVEPVTFEFFGEQFEAAGEIPAILALQVGAAQAGKVGGPDLTATVWQVLRRALSKPGPAEDGSPGPADYAEFNRFYLLALERNCSIDELFRLSWALMGFQAGKADEPQDTSPPLSPPTGQGSSESASPSPDSPRLVSVDEVLGG